MSDGCVRCGEPLRSMGVSEFRVGGTTGGWKLVFGELAELGEGMLPFYVWVCSACGRVELRVPGAPSPAADPTDEPASRWDDVWATRDRQAWGSGGS